MRLIKLAYLASALALAGSLQAAELYDNGSPDNSGNGVNNSYQSVMDDVYVPGAGWYAEEVQTQGIFFNGSSTVTEVDITIWQSDPSTFEPDGDYTEFFNNVPFNVLVTGEQWEGYDKIHVVADIPRTFMKGQEYHWVEFDIKDQYGQRMKLIERQSVNHLPAHLRSNPYPFASDVDLAFKIYGDEIKVLVLGSANDFQVKGLDNKQETLTFQIPDGSKQFDAGLYQLQQIRKSPVLYRFDREGKHRVEFKANPSEPAKFHTPLGDDMCAGAPGSLQDYCQSLVACAAYELWCPGL